MATLDNFHTFNHPHPSHPSLRDRYRWIQSGLSNNQTWDPTSYGPVAPVATYHPGARATAHPSPQVTETLEHRSMKDYLVPVRPYTQLRFGDSADHLLLHNPSTVGAGRPQGWWDRLRARVPTHSRFHPYLK